MVSSAELVAAASSSVVRLSAITFLRWIPGHHFPPIILTATALYLACVFGYPDAYGSKRPTLHEAFPSLFKKDKENGLVNKQDEGHDHDEPILYEDEKHLVKTLFLGIPNWRESEYSYLTIAINVLLALFTLDLVFRGPLLYPAQDLRFARVGYVDSTSAKLLFREPDPAQLPVFAYYKPNTEKSSWTIADRVYYLGSDTDFTYPLTLSGLRPSTTYTYSLSNDLSGTFTTAPAPHSAAASELTFLTSSCIKANFPYRPFSHALSMHGFEHLSKIVRSLTSPASFMLFLGDFIYVDVPLRLSSSLAHYRAEYRRVYASPSWSLPGLSTLPWIHTLDDHEIANDWSAGNDTDPFPAASDPFIHYHVSANPPVPPAAPIGPDTNTTYFQFTRGPASFFMLDTRRYRTDPEPQSSLSITSKPLYGDSSTPPNPASNHTMLGATQLASLLDYLSTPEPAGVHWKIIASSVPFTKNWRFGTSDTWGGFPAERAQILSAMHAAERDHNIRVVILSGDRHEFAAIRYPPPVVRYTTLTDISITVPVDETVQKTIYDSTPGSGPHEFSVGPLSMFYLPFRTFKQIDEEDVAIKYVPDGNSKVGVVEIKNLKKGSRGHEKSVLKYSLFVDGKLSWEYELGSPGAGYRGKVWTGTGSLQS